MTISVSTNLASSSMPFSAARMRRVPSKLNGLVTTPTVSTPRSRAARAITGAAPVPVPPPMPAVMKSMWQPSVSAMTSSSASSAAARPMSGSAPAPRPLVRLAPSRMRLGAVREAQRLRVGVGHQEFDALEIGADHVVDRIASRAADPDNRDSRPHLDIVGRRVKVDCAHRVLLSGQPADLGFLVRCAGASMRRSGRRDG